MPDPPPTNRSSGPRGQTAGLLLALIRGLLSWIVVPLTTFAWLLMWPYLRAKRIGTTDTAWDAFRRAG